MYTPIEPTPEIDELNSRCKELLAEIFARVSPSKAGVRLLADCPVYDSPERKGCFHLIKEGGLSYIRDGKQLFIYEEGDLIGIEQHFGPTSAVISSDFSVIVDEYQAEEFFATVRADPDLFGKWDAYLACQLSMMSALLSRLKACEVSLRPEIRTYAPGETIITEGTEASEVYTMVDGHARVYVKDVQVGEIGGDEIFGALAVLTNTTRSASVVAAEPSMVIVLKRDQFVDLIQNRPLTVLKMVEDMARTIQSLNGQVVGLAPRKVL